MTFVDYVEKENEESLKRLIENGKRVRKAHEDFCKAI